MSISALIVDDEKLAREELRFLLQDDPEVEIVGEASNGPEALEMIDHLQPDLVLMDVQMPGLDGIGVVRALIEKGAALPHFIFATAFDQYAVEAFEVEATDYLLKPIDKQRFEKSVEKAKKRIASPDQEVRQVEQLLSRLQQGSPRPPTKLLVRSGERMILVDEADVVFATIDTGTITVSAEAAQGVSNYRTIEELQSHLDAATFWRPHRSYLVNINRIKEVVPWFNSTYQLRMSDKNETEVPVSRGQTKKLRELFKL